MAQDYRNTISDVTSVINLGIKRSVPTNKLDLHFGDFSPIINLLNSLNIESNFFTKDLSLEDFYNLSGQTLKTLTARLANYTITSDEIVKVYDYLSEEDNLEKSDFIFVFGGRSFERPKKAAELYLGGLAPLIYCSGSRPIEESTREHEGRKYKNYIQDNYKIDESKVIVDPNENSLSMVANVRGFLNWCDEKNLKLNKVILIIQEHNLRRAWAIFNKYSNNVKIIRCSCGHLENLTRDAWFKTEIGIKLIYEEYEKIKIQHIMLSS